MANERNPQTPKSPPTDKTPTATDPAVHTDSSIHAPLPKKPDSVVSFDLSSPISEESERTIGASLSDFPELRQHLQPGDSSKVLEPSTFDIDLPPDQTASSSNLFGTHVPTAEPISSDSAVANLEGFAPVVPASGWFDSQIDHAVPTAMPIEGPASDAPGAALSGVLGGSDIFSGPGPIAQPKSDVSDVIMATAYVPPTSVEKPSAKIHSSRQSDVALNFDAPPGGSTLQDAAADADLPVAKEVHESSDSLFGGDDDDSANLTRTPKMPLEADRADLGSTPAGGLDASSILADLSEHGSDPGDSSAIRLEAPGVQHTRDANRSPEFTRDSTEEDLDLAEEEAGDWRSNSGSDLFADRTRSDFELLPDAGAVDPFADDITADQPSLSTAPSSIFSGGRVPGGGSSDPANPESVDAVEFSDHPDPTAADSGAFHVTPAGAVDFDMPDDPHPERTMRTAVPEDEWDEGKTQVGPASGILYRKPKSVHEMAPVPGTPVKPKSKAEIVPTDPSMEVDWVSSDSAVGMEAPSGINSQPSEPRRRERSTDDSGSGKRGFVGAAFGLLVGVGLSAGAYFSGLVPNKEEVKPIPVANNNVLPANTNNAPPAPATVDAQAALHGDPASAMKAIEASGAKTAQDKAALGQARLFARLRELANTNAAVKADDAEIARTRTELEGAMNDPAAANSPETEKAAVRAALHLGLTYEAAGDRARAQEIYTGAIAKFPKSAELFQTALDRLSATAPEMSKTSSRLTPREAEQLASAAVILLVLEPVAVAPSEEPAEAGAFFWKAVNAAAAGKYDAAVKRIAEAKQAHEKRAKALAGRGLNPLSDPLEQIFPRCGDELTAYWQLRKTLYEHPGVGAALKKDVAKALDQLAGAEKRALDNAKIAADLKTSNDTLAADLKSEKDKVAAAAKDLKAEKDAVANLEAEAKTFAKTTDALKETFKKNELKTRAAIAKLDEEIEQLKLVEARLKKEASDRQTAIAAVAKELQGAKLLPAKFDDAGLLAAVKSTVSRATGPDLTKLVPPDLSAIVGPGLTTGHLLTLASRANAAEASARKAADANKKLVAAHVADLKRVADAAAVAVEKQKADDAAKLKAAADQYAIDAKKLADANAVKVKSLETAIAREKRRFEDAEDRFKAQFGDALSPSQQLDLWLALLVELRRPADADPAYVAATKALRTADPDSPDAAKAETVAGLALLLKNDAEAARAMFDRAKRSPAYADAKGKGWAAALEVGAAAVVDPSAIVREPFRTGAKQKDPLAAARNLDAGITAYKAGRYAEAQRALAEAAWHDPNDALAWYFLGASRWAQGKQTEAKADYQQGAAREAQRLVPGRQIDSALRPIQGAARDALSAARP